MIEVTRGALELLLSKMGGETYQRIKLEPFEVDGKTGLKATVEHDDQRDPWVEKFLVIGDGVVKL